ncbi:MAG: hypothetical protein AABX70_06550 [Nanoarchaeota archaeon]
MTSPRKRGGLMLMNHTLTEGAADRIGRIALAHPPTGSRTEINNSMLDRARSLGSDGFVDMRESLGPDFRGWGWTGNYGDAIVLQKQGDSYILHAALAPGQNVIGREKLRVARLALEDVVIHNGECSSGLLSTIYCGERRDIPVREEQGIMEILKKECPWFFDHLPLEVKKDLGYTRSSSGSLEGRLLDLFPKMGTERLGALIGTVEGKIINLNLITNTTLSGLTGGGVGRVRFADDDNEYVFKICGDETHAKRSAHIPSKIYEYADQDQWAALLARRTPRAYFPEAVQHNRYWITLHEDRTNQIVDPTQLEWSIIKPEMERLRRYGLDPEKSYSLANRLFTVALYQEVMTKIAREEEPLFKPSPTNVLREEIEKNIRTRTGPRYESIRQPLGQMFAGYNDTVAELETLEMSGTTFCHGDPKTENWVGMTLADHGLSRRGSEVEDLARILMDQVAVAQNPALLKMCVEGFVRMKQAISPNYTPPPELGRLVRNQTRIDAVRGLGTPRQEKFETYLAVATGL